MEAWQEPPKAAASAEWTFGDNLFEVESAADIRLDDFVAAMDRRTFSCIRGLVKPGTMYALHERIVKQFDPRRDSPTVGNPADAVRRNFQKLNVGGERQGASNDDARLFRAVYTPFWEEDIWGLHEPLRQLARVRNRLAGLAPDFALHRIEDNGLWTAARFHQYPRGGGFFRRHTDYVAKDVADEKSTRFFQVVLTMTRKGEHYTQGGAFVDVGDTRVNLDDHALMGDIIIYDGRTMHGVEDIDPNVPLDMGTLNGRLSGFATLYKKM